MIKNAITKAALADKVAICFVLCRGKPIENVYNFHFEFPHNKEK
jgi:hypothetical protein